MKLILNAVLTAIVIMIFHLMGWINITHTFGFTEGNQLMNAALVALVVGFLYNVILTVVAIVFMLSMFATCFIGCIFFPFYLLGGASLIALFGVTQLLPNWINTTGTSLPQLWILLLAMYWVRKGSASEAKQTAVTKTVRTRTSDSRSSVYD